MTGVKSVKLERLIRWSKSKSRLSRPPKGAPHKYKNYNGVTVTDKIVPYRDDIGIPISSLTSPRRLDDGIQSEQ